MPRPALSSAPLRCLLGLATAALLLPTAGRAQLPQLPSDSDAGARLRLTPFAGWATGVSRSETWSFSDSDGNVFKESVETDLAGGPAAGLTLEFAWRGPFSVLAGAAFVQRDEAVFTVDNAEPLVYTGSTNVLVKLGLGVELREQLDEMTMRRLAAGAFLAPFYMLELPDELAGFDDDELFDPAHHFGLNLGVTGELPFAADRLALQLGFEDYVTLWSAGALERLPTWFNATATEVAADVTHQLLVRAGLSFRFH